MTQLIPPPLESSVPPVPVMPHASSSLAVGDNLWCAMNDQRPTVTLQGLSGTYVTTDTEISMTSSE